MPLNILNSHHTAHHIHTNGSKEPKITMSAAKHPSATTRAWIRVKGHMLWTIATSVAIVALVFATIAIIRVYSSGEHTLIGRLKCDAEAGRCTLSNGTILRLVSGDGDTMADFQTRTSGLNITVSDKTVGGKGSRAIFTADGNLSTVDAQTAAPILTINQTCLQQASTCSSIVTSS